MDADGAASAWRSFVDVVVVRADTTTTTCTRLCDWVAAAYRAAVSDEERAVVDLMVDLDQTHVFDRWAQPAEERGLPNEQKSKFFEQVRSDEILIDYANEILIYGVSLHT